MDITKVYGTFISGSSPDGCTKNPALLPVFYCQIKRKSALWTKIKKETQRCINI